jgi:hypothetical protein
MGPRFGQLFFQFSPKKGVFTASNQVRNFGSGSADILSSVLITRDIPTHQTAVTLYQKKADILHLQALFHTAHDMAQQIIAVKDL